MHFRSAFIFSTYGLYFLPGSNFAPFEEVKVPVSNIAKFVSKKSAPWRILEDLGWLGLVWTDPFIGPMIFRFRKVQIPFSKILNSVSG